MSTKQFGHLQPLDRWVHRMWFGTDDFELIVNWYDFHDREGKLTACLEVFEDTWHAFPHIQDVLTALAQASRKHIQPDEFAQLLINCGYQLDNKEVSLP